MADVTVADIEAARGCRPLSQPQGQGCSDNRRVLRESVPPPSYISSFRERKSPSSTSTQMRPKHSARRSHREGDRVHGAAVHPLRPARHRGAARRGRAPVAARWGRSRCWSTTPPTTSATRSTTVTPEYWDDRIAVNLRHQFFAAQAVAPDDERPAAARSSTSARPRGWSARAACRPITAAKAAVSG